MTTPDFNIAVAARDHMPAKAEALEREAFALIERAKALMAEAGTARLIAAVAEDARAALGVEGEA